MRKLFFLLYAILLSSLYVSAQRLSTPCKFVFSGEIIGQDTGFIYLSYMDKDNRYIRDSCALKKGMFRFEGAICEPTDAFFQGKTKSRSVSDPNSTDIFLEPKVITGIFKIDHFKNGKIEGSKTQQEYKELVQNTSRIDASIDSIKRELSKAKKKEKELNRKLSYYRTTHLNVYYNFINEHPDSYVSANFLRMLQGGRLTLDSVKIFYNRLSDKIQNSREGRIILKGIKKAESVAIGKTAPDFIQNNVNGDPVSLKRFSGKYVLLDFWASWCVPCRQENTYLKSVYQKYKSKGFTIIGISLDTDTAKWEAAIKEDKLHWTQLSDLKGMQNSVAEKYNVRPIPDNFLIDPTGKIIARDIEGEDILKRLKEVFEKGPKL